MTCALTRRLTPTRLDTWLRGAFTHASLWAALSCRGPSPQTEENHTEPQPSSIPTEWRVRGRAEIPAGVFQSGTVPGTLSRKPELEPSPQATELGPFHIDRFAYPGDPGGPLGRAGSPAEAAALCVEREGRLCGELEWERACKGPSSLPFSSGEHWAAQCEAAPSECFNAFGVAGLGAFAEWTASVGERPGTSERLAVVRAASSGDSERRCAHRTLVPFEGNAEPLAFRCCYGPPNAATIVVASGRPAFELTTLSRADLVAVLEQHALTKPLAPDAKFFKEPDAAETVVARGSGDRKGFSFTVAPLLWAPVTGTQFLAITGASGKDRAFVLVYHVLGPHEYHLVSSFLMEHEPGPIAFAYSGDIRPRFHFSSCWGCPGETGKILYRDPDQAVILQP